VSPSRKGFGSRLIYQTIVVELQGTVDMTYNEEGLKAVIAIPLNDADADRDQVGSETARATTLAGV
jgi:two-component sensor histidine kinase